MQRCRITCAVVLLSAMAATTSITARAAAEAVVDRAAMSDEHPAAALPNASFAPGDGAMVAPPFEARLRIAQTEMQTIPALEQPVVGGRDARLFPGITLEFFTLGGVLVPVQRGEMVAESAPGRSSSYWRVIPQFGKVWRLPGDDGWSRAAFPLMLVNDTENHAHQGLVLFLYRDGLISRVRFQFVQQTAPYLVRPHFVAYGSAAAERLPATLGSAEAPRTEARAELDARLPARPWDELVRTLPHGALDGFGGPLDPKWVVATALVRGGTLYYRAAGTPYGDYPYPLEMRFGVRSIMKSVATPLSLLRLAEVYGPYVLNLKVGDYVAGLDPKYRQVRFIDAANMASGFGGTGTFRTHPNDLFDGYLEGDYDAWYTAPSHAEKVAQIASHLRPYPWEPGTVMRYRDQDFYLLGVAVNNFLKSVRGADADVWAMLQEEVFKPIGIWHAPAVRTRESGDRPGPVWFNAGYYPTLDDLAKIALLFQDRGAHGGRQILHRQLTQDLLAGRDAIATNGDGSVDPQASVAAAGSSELYRMGFHFQPFHRRNGSLTYIPTMSGSGENEVILLPNGLVTIRTAKAAGLPKDVKINSGEGPMTIEAVERFAPF